MFKHLLAVADEVLGVDDWEPDVVFPEEVGKHLLALDLRNVAKIPVPPKKVEGVVDETALFVRGEFCLEFREIRSSLVNDDHFPVDDCLTGNVQSAGDRGKPLHPIQAVASVGLLAASVRMKLNAVAVIFDFVQPPPRGSL